MDDLVPGATSYANVPEKNTILAWIARMAVYEFDFIVAFFGFLFVRYTLPHSVLGRDVSLGAGLVLAFGFALYGYIRALLMQWKENLG
jgi:hypothetical protein